MKGGISVRDKRTKKIDKDMYVEARDESFTDVARMVDDGLASGLVTEDNGRVGNETLSNRRSSTDSE